MQPYRHNGLFQVSVVPASKLRQKSSQIQLQVKMASQGVQVVTLILSWATRAMPLRLTRQALAVWRDDPVTQEPQQTEQLCRFASGQTLQHK